MKVFKYEIPVEDKFSILLPVGAEIIDVKVQFGIPCFWALVDDSAENEKRLFKLAGTGHEVGEVSNHIGSFHLHALVFHLFECEDIT